MDGFSMSLRSIANHERDHKGEIELAGIINCAADRMESDAKEIAALREVLQMGVQLCESGGHGRGDKCPTCHFMREAQKALGTHEQTAGENKS